MLAESLDGALSNTRTTMLSTSWKQLVLTP